MSAVQKYRYFLGFRPPPDVRDDIIEKAAHLGIFLNAEDLMRLHLTLCVIAEQPERSAFLAATVGGAIGGRSLASAKVKLGRLVSGGNGVLLRSIGRQDNLIALYSELTSLIASRGLFPLHRKSGLRPHLTLSYKGNARLKALIPIEWVPDELLLIESWDGASKHIVLARWPLASPLQGAFDFGKRCQQLRDAA